jgi:hypothetical protein
MVDLTGYVITFADEFENRSISQTGLTTTWADIRKEWRFDANSDIGFGKSSFVDPDSGFDPFEVNDGILTIAAVPDRTPSGYPEPPRVCRRPWVVNHAAISMLSAAA